MNEKVKQALENFNCIKEDLDYLFSIYDLDELRGIRSDLTSSFLVDGLGKDVRKK